MRRPTVTTWWRASVLAAAGAAALLAGCGIRLAEAPLPEPARTVASPVAEIASPAAAASAQLSPSADATLQPLTPIAPSGSVSASPSASATATSAPSVTPLQVTPAPVAQRDAALAAAARRVRAAAAVRAAVPAFDQLVAGMVARSGVPGAAVAVVAGDTVMYSRCFGLREIGTPDAVDDDTLFQLGGVSRAYTTTLLAALAGEGELAWDQPVRRVWPGFRLRDPWAAREATFEDLTAARSGLPAYAGSELRAFGYSRAEILRRLRHLRPAAGFRAAWAPQDALVVAAAAAAERVTGRSWARSLQSRVLAPIGASDTLVGFRSFVRAIDTATPHRSVDGTMVPQDPLDEDVFAPSLGVSSSLNDLVGFARLQLNGGALGGVRVAPAALLARTVRPATAMADSPDGALAAGLGWQLSTLDDKRVVQAAGGLACGSSAVVSLLPEDGVAVVVLANAYPQGLALGRALTHTLVDFEALGVPRDDWLAAEQALVQDETLTPEAGGDWQAQAGAAAGRGVTLSPGPPAGAVPARTRSAYAGVYEDAYYGRVTVSRGAGDGLDVLLGRGVTLRYVPWSGDVWRDVASGTAAVFDVRGGRARAVTLTLLTFDGRRGEFVRVR
jgi:CubicO group peptidase (beta-lactamase class C family)